MISTGAESFEDVTVLPFVLAPYLPTGSPGPSFGSDGGHGVTEGVTGGVMAW